MPTTISVGPLTRIEGHLDIAATLGDDGNVLDAQSAGTMFRGFELLLQGRDPRDAPHLTQRICGVCPISHGMAACKNLESAFGVTVPDAGRILRNLILGSNFIQSHVLHFYHLAALDYVDTTGILDKAPWTPRFVCDDMIRDEDTVKALVAHYVEAIRIRREAHRMGAIFGGKLPCSPSFVPGGCSAPVTTEKIALFRRILADILRFIDETYVPDVELLASAFPRYYQIGRGCGNLLAYGVFDQDSAGTSKLLARGRFTSGQEAAVDPGKIVEYVKHSYYSPASGNRNPADGLTEPQPDKADSYSWLKAPRYDTLPHECGPLARMWVNGDYQRGISVMDRLMARALETRKIAGAMSDWLDQLQPNESTQNSGRTPTTATGIGLTEAPRGALGHWIEIREGKIDRYQVITPTAWNASPRDDNDVPGPVEQALAGTPVTDPSQPIELMRVVHSFDPCLACSVHTIRPKPVPGGAVENL